MKFLTVLLSLVISTISFSKDYEKEKKSLTKMQYYVTQEDGTEPAFENKYWNNKKEGIYVDVVSENLYSVLLINLNLVPAGPLLQNQ